MTNHSILWFDKDPEKSVRDKILEGIEYFEKRYPGEKAEMCFMNPADEPEGVVAVPIFVQYLDAVKPNHFWIGPLDALIQTHPASPDMIEDETSYPTPEEEADHYEQTVGDAYDGDACDNERCKHDRS